MAVVLIAMLLGIISWNRNQLWLSPVNLLVDNVQKRPDNARIYAGAANALTETGDFRGGATASSARIPAWSPPCGNVHQPDQHTDH